jgi:hypothetical protein
MADVSGMMWQLIIRINVRVRCADKFWVLLIRKGIVLKREDMTKVVMRNASYKRSVVLSDMIKLV